MTWSLSRSIRTPRRVPDQGLARSQVWGGHALRGDDGRWHWHGSVLTGNCGLAGWATNSEAGHAVASAPEGPYALESIVRQAHREKWHIAEALSAVSIRQTPPTPSFVPLPIPSWRYLTDCPGVAQVLQARGPPHWDGGSIHGVQVVQNPKPEPDGSDKYVMYYTGFTAGPGSTHSQPQKRTCLGRGREVADAVFLGARPARSHWPTMAMCQLLLSGSVHKPRCRPRGNPANPNGFSEDWRRLCGVFERTMDPAAIPNLQCQQQQQRLRHEHGVQRSASVSLERQRRRPVGVQGPRSPRSQRPAQTLHGRKWCAVHRLRGSGSLAGPV